jgi:hypothetical protein
MPNKSKANPIQAVEARRVARGWGFQVFRHSAHRWRQDCQPYAPAAFYREEDFWYSFLLEAESFKSNTKYKGKKGKAVPVTGRGGTYGCETSRLSYFLYIRLTDGGKVVSLTRRLPFIHKNIPGTDIS